MKTTYLAKKEGRLIEITAAEWYAIIQKNRKASPEHRRYFIVDCIGKGKELDRMYLEVSCEEHRKWNREHTASMRNQKTKGNADTVSLDDDRLWMSDAQLADPHCIETNMVSKIRVEELVEALRHWKPWAMDCYKAYMAGEKRSCTILLEKKYGVSKQTARSYKRKFEEFVKNFLL